jgi:predicted metallopeptidase
MARTYRKPDGTPVIEIDVDQERPAAVFAAARAVLGIADKDAPEGVDFYRSEEVEAAADAHIDRHLTLFRLRDFRLVYLLRQVDGPLEEVHLDAIGKAFKAPGIWRDVAGVDAGIWIDERYWQRFDARQREAIVLHELLHLEVTDKGTIKIADHDVEEFGMVVALYGAWLPRYQRFAEQLALFGTPEAPAKAANG